MKLFIVLFAICLASQATSSPLARQLIPILGGLPAIDSNGCPIYLFACAIYCPFGNAVDENGCRKPCACASNSNLLQPIINTIHVLPKEDTIVIEPPKCKPCLTTVVCSTGIKYDEFGCRICKC